MSSTPPPPANEPLPTIDGRALAFGLRLGADEIVGPGGRLFAELDATLADQVAIDDVIVAEEIAGSAETAEAACTALASAGIRALVARRFAIAITTAARRAGLLALVLDTPNFLRTGDRVRIDLDTGKIVNLSSGDRAPIRNLDDALPDSLRASPHA